MKLWKIELQRELKHGLFFCLLLCLFIKATFQAVWVEKRFRKAKLKCQSLALAGQKWLEASMWSDSCELKRSENRLQQFRWRILYWANFNFSWPSCDCFLTLNFFCSSEKFGMWEEGKVSCQQAPLTHGGSGFSSLDKRTPVYHFYQISPADLNFNIVSVVII